MLASCTQWSPGSKGQEAASFRNKRNNSFSDTYSEQERNHLKKGEKPVLDDAAAEGGNAEVLVPVVGNCDEVGMVEDLLHIRITVSFLF
jgi:hypothetical protein